MPKPSYKIVIYGSFSRGFGSYHFYKSRTANFNHTPDLLISIDEFRRIFGRLIKNNKFRIEMTVTMLNSPTHEYEFYHPEFKGK